MCALYVFDKMPKWKKIIVVQQIKAMEVELSSETQCSKEEEDEIGRRSKKFKDSSGDKPFSPPQGMVSYRDSLIGDILGAYE